MYRITSTAASPRGYCRSYLEFPLELWEFLPRFWNAASLRRTCRCFWSCSHSPNWTQIWWHPPSAWTERKSVLIADGHYLSSDGKFQSYTTNQANLHTHCVRPRAITTLADHAVPAVWRHSIKHWPAFLALLPRLWSAAGDSDLQASLLSWSGHLGSTEI